MTDSEKVTQYIGNAPMEHTEIMQKLRGILLSIDGVTEKIKWSYPVFSKGIDLVYLRTNKKHVTFGFFDGRKLTDPDGMLEGGGEKMKHQKIRTIDEIDEAKARKWVEELID